MSDAPKMPEKIWAYSQWGDNCDKGEWDQSESPDCGKDWPHARYIRADLHRNLEDRAADLEADNDKWSDLANRAGAMMVKCDEERLRLKAKAEKSEAMAAKLAEALQCWIAEEESKGRSGTISAYAILAEYEASK